MTLAADTSVRDEEITAFFSADPKTIAWPYPMYERWRQGSGVVRWHGGPATLITRYADVKDGMAGKYPIKPKDRKSTRLNSSHANISYAVFCLKKKKKKVQ